MTSSTSNNPWPGRLLRFSALLALILLAVVLVRFTTYKDMLYDETVDCPTVTYSTTFTGSTDPHVEYMPPRKPVSIINVLTADGVSSSLSADYDWDTGTYSGTVFETHPACDWLMSDFGASRSDWEDGTLLAVIVAGGVFVVFVGLLVLAIVVRWAWRGPRRRTNFQLCADASCSCEIHQGEQFNYERKCWESTCHDSSCTCVEHAVDKFDAEAGSWT